MRTTFFLLATLASFALAAPLALNNDNVHAVARTEYSLVLRDVAVENRKRQLAPGGLGNIQFDKIIDEVTTTLKGTVGMTTDQVKTVVEIVTGLLGGGGFSGNTIGKLTSIPASILAKLPALLGPILIPATTALPLVGGLVTLLLNLLSTLGGAVGGLGGAVGGAAGDIAHRDVLQGLDINAILGGLGNTLKGQDDVPDNVIGTVLSLVKGLLGGEALNTSSLGQLTTLPTNALSGIIGALTKTVAGLPGIGPLLAPLLSVLNLLLALGPGLIGGLTSSVGGAVGSAGGAGRLI